MSEKSAMNVDLREMQEKVEDGMQSAKNVSRKVVLASIGVWGLAYDKAQDLWDSGMGLVDKAEKRGEELEQDLNKRFNKMQEQPQVKKVVVAVEDSYDNVSKNAKTVVTEVEKFLAQFQAKGEEVAKDVTIEVEKAVEAVEAVLPGYDEMAAKDIVGKLPGMPKEKLIEIREYEVKGKNRVTVLREIDVLLETPDTVTI